MSCLIIRDYLHPLPTIIVRSLCKVLCSKLMILQVLKTLKYNVFGVKLRILLVDKKKELKKIEKLLFIILKIIFSRIS